MWKEDLPHSADFRASYNTVFHANADLPTPITRKSGGFEKQAQKNLEIRASNLETSKLFVK